MEPLDSSQALAGLERSCAAGPGPGDWLRRAPSRPGFERYEARFGTGPHRYRNQRRLERARRLIEDGLPLAAAALSCGFADQSHMTRHFKKTYGLPPGRWAAMARAAPG